VYYHDRVTGDSVWEKPITWDVDPYTEKQRDDARTVLRTFYSKYNPNRLTAMDEILTAYGGKYSELFIQLAEKYNVEDLTMFMGVHIDWYWQTHGDCQQQLNQNAW